MAQVESLAQLGVQLLLFHLGRELSLSKLKAVWSVALVGGTLQIVALSALGGIIAAFVESPVAQVCVCVCVVRVGGWVELSHDMPRNRSTRPPLLH
jgi:Kef-type K+ transport system membrane component KefB